VTGACVTERVSRGGGKGRSMAGASFAAIRVRKIMPRKTAAEKRLA